MVLSRLQRGNHGLRRGRVAESHGDVAQPALVADAPDRRALQPLDELGLGPREQLDQRGVLETIAGLEVLLTTHLCEAVPRANRLAVVAAVDAVADQRPQLLG